MDPDEQALLIAAQRGERDAFDALVAPYRPALRAHCYRMLGSLPDAEDAVQETLVRAWTGLARFEGRSSVRSWLHTVATNAGLRLIEQRPARLLPIDVSGPAADGEIAWLDPYPDAGLPVGALEVGPDVRYEQRESVELAFVAALQHLPARQRATLILRDVLGFSARETAEALDTTPASIDSIMQRARRTVAERVPERSQQATLRAVGDDGVRDLVARFSAAWENDDVDALVTMLTDGARLAMPPEAGWFLGPEPIARFLRARPLTGDHRFRLRPVTANAQPALAAYQYDPGTGSYAPESLIVLTLAGSRIDQITAFRYPGLLPLFDRQVGEPV